MFCDCEVGRLSEDVTHEFSACIFLACVCVLVCVSSSLDEVWTDDGDLEMGLLFHCDIVMGTP